MATYLAHHGLKFRAKALLLASFMVSIPWLGLIFMVGNQRDDLVEFRNDVFPALLRNLTNQGVLGLQDKGLIVVNDDDKLVSSQSQSHVHVLNKMDVVPFLDLERKQLADFEHDYDVAFTHEISIQLVDKLLKVDGIMVVLVQKKGDHSQTFQKPSNHEILYSRHDPGFDVTIIVMKKTTTVGEDNMNNIPHRRLMFEQKKAEALKNLESVLLEPPRTKSSGYSKKTRYLPDLMDDSLEDYPRRVFIDVNSGDDDWLSKNYPTRNTNFEIYQVETTMAAETLMEVEVEVEGVSVKSEITDWLRENVKMDEYVVMKGEADVVEELVKSKAIELVDELFLECKYQGIKCQKCKRPYWKCLALYGLLKDAGVAVHQWWG